MRRISRKVRRGTLARRSIVLLAMALTLAVAGVAFAGPGGDIVVVPGTSTQNLDGIVKFGPINPVDGFPEWYRDSNAEEVEPCVQAADLMCNGPEVPFPGLPTVFPDNFPPEFFYYMGEAALTAAGGNDVLAMYALEGTFASEVPGQTNDQMTFTRTRYRIRGGLQPATQYKITNPYGVDVIKSDEAGTDPDNPALAQLFVSEDIGASVGAFGALFAGQVGPFLKWDATLPTAPAGYYGDPLIPHTVTGSPFNTNFVMIEGPGIGGANNPNPCTNLGLTPTTSPNCIYTDRFAIMAKKSTRGGVDVARATYSRSATGAVPQLDVFAESKASQDIVVTDTQAGVDQRFPLTPLVGALGQYFTHIDIKGPVGSPVGTGIDPPQQVKVTNRGDAPDTVKTVNVTDQVLGAALYDTTTNTLSVTARSSDKAAGVAKLTLPAYGNVQADALGVFAPVALDPAPATVLVKSSQGGTAQVAVEVVGPGNPSEALLANAGPDQDAEQTASVTLDGTQSTGTINSVQWTQTAGDPVVLSDGTAMMPTFTAPATRGDLTFQLTVSGIDQAGPGNVSDAVTVHVLPLRDAQAIVTLGGTQIAPDPGTADVAQNLPVTLDGSASIGDAAYDWAYVSGPAVSLGTTSGSTLAFTYPKTTVDAPVVLSLTVRNPNVAAADCTPTTCDTVQFTLAPIVDALVITTARFDPLAIRQSEPTTLWRVDGTATSSTQNKVHVYSGPTADPAMEITGSPFDVLPDVTWSSGNVLGSAVPLHPCKCVTAVSDRGGLVESFPIEKADRLPDPLPPVVITVPAPLTVAPLTAPLTGVAALTTPTVAPIAAFTPAALAGAGVPLAITVPAGARVLRVRVLTIPGRGRGASLATVKGRVLYRAFRTVTVAKKGQTVLFRLRSRKLAAKVRPGHRYVLEITPGLGRTRLGTPARRTFRVR